MRANGARNLGIVLNLGMAQAATNAPEDLAATDRADAVFNRWYLDGLFKGRYPEIMVQWLGEYLPDGMKTTWTWSRARLIGWVSTTTIGGFTRLQAFRACRPNRYLTARKN